MLTMKLHAAARTPSTKGASRRLRSAGQIPGIVYGHGEESTPFALDQQEFGALLRHREGTTIIELDLDGKPPQQTIIRSIQRDPVTGRVIHVDLQHISMTEPVQVEVPIQLHGTAVGVKNEGGVLEFHLRSVSVKCLPTAIPGHIDVDVSDLSIGKSIHVSDLPVDREQVTVLTDERMTIVGVVAPRVATGEPGAEGEAAEGAAEPEAAEAPSAEASE